MGGPLRSKRNGTSAVAGRYLAAIGAGAVGACGDLESQTLSPVTAVCAVPGGATTNASGNGRHRRKNSFAAAIMLEPQQQKAAPKTPTKQESHTGKSPFISGPSPFAASQQQQGQARGSPQFFHQPKAQHSPSLATATTAGDFSYSMATSASPSSRNRSGTTLSRSPVSNYSQQQEAKASSSKFFNIFPSAKIALRSSNLKREQEAAMAAAVQPPPPPPPPQQQKQHSKHNKGNRYGSSAVHPQTPTQPQHLQHQQAGCMAAGVELVFQGASQLAPSQTPPASYPLTRSSGGMPRKGLDNLTKVPTSEDVLSAAGAPTEIMTNRASERRYVMEPQDALWRKKKKASSITNLSQQTNQRNHQHRHSFYPEDESDEEKKQDSDAESFRSLQQERNLAANTDPQQQQDDLLLFGPIPLERTNTRRTSNRGNLKHHQQSQAPYPAAATSTPAQSSSYRQYLLHSSQQEQQQQPQESYKTSPRLHQHINNNNTRSSPGAYVRRNRNNDTPLDTKSLLSNSTCESSSRHSPPTLLNPILDSADAAIFGRTGNQQNPTSSNTQQHWWSADKAKINNCSYRKSPMAAQEVPLSKSESKASKAVVAYPESPPASLKQQQDNEVTEEPQNITHKDISGSKTVDVSCDSKSTDAGVIGLMDDDDDDNDVNDRVLFGIAPIEATIQGTPAINIPKLAPSKQDYNTKNHASSTPPRTAPSIQSGARQPQVNLKPRMNTRAKAVVENTDPNRSVVSESSGWTPIAMSEDGLNFSSDNDAPLLPLFFQDRFDFGPGGPRRDKSTSHSQLEQKLVRSNQDDGGAFEHSKLQGAEGGHATRPSASPEIWRIGQNDTMNSMLSADPIFCTQPSQANSSMISSIAQTDSLLTKNILSLSPNVEGRMETPTVGKNTVAPELQQQSLDRRLSSGKPPTSPHRSEGQRMEHSAVSMRYAGNGVPKRTASGPAFGKFRSSNEVVKDTEDNGTVSSRQVETGACDGSTGSLPRRSKSDRSGIKAANDSRRPRGAFQAAFAAFEKSSRGRVDSYSFDGGQGEDGKPSRLALVLNAHLTKEANEKATQGSGSVSVDVQSIRSAFEAAGQQEGDDDDDDDTASVRSLREVFEAADQPVADNAVTKMRALFENQKPPSAKDFETGNAELKEAWKKFDKTDSKPRRAISNRLRQHTPGNKPPRPSGPSGTSKQFSSIADRAKMFESKAPCQKMSNTDKAETDVESPSCCSMENADVKGNAVEYRPPSVPVLPDDTTGNTGGRSLSAPENDAAKVEIHTAEIRASLDDAFKQSSTTSPDVSIPSDRMEPVVTNNGQSSPLDKLQTASAASSEKIVSPPRLGIQSEPRGKDRVKKVDYLPKDFSPHSRASKSKEKRQHIGDRDTVTASEGEFSDGVTLDLSIADVSQLTNPTYQGKAEDESTLDNSSVVEKTVEIDLEAKRSEASSSQQTEAAAPLIANAMKKLSDDMSLESRNQMAKLWEKSALLGPSLNTSADEEPKLVEQSVENSWDACHVQASFPVNEFPNSDDFFGLEPEPSQDWLPFDNNKFWVANPDLASSHEAKKIEIMAGSAVSHARDPDGVRFDRRSNTSVHVAEVPTKEKPAQSQSRTFESEKSAIGPVAHLGSTTAKAYARSHMYSQARQHAKAMLAARSPKKNASDPKTPPRFNVNQSPPSTTPKSPHSRATSTTSPSSTPPRDLSPGFRPVTPNSLTPTSSSVTSKSYSKTPSTRPITPTQQRAITPTINNLRSSHIHSTAPKVSYRSDSYLPSTFPEPPQEFNKLWVSHGNTYTASRGYDEFKHDDFFSTPFPFPGSVPDPEVHVIATEKFSFPAFEESKETSFTSATNDEDFFSPQGMRSRGTPSRYTSQAPQGTMFSRTHPTSHESIRQRKHSTAAHVQSFRKSSFAAPQDKLIRPTLHYAASEHSNAKGAPTSGRLASVVGKHAALMARLKVLKAARIKRSTDTSPYGHEQLAGVSLSDTGTSTRPKSSIGRAIASVYKSRRGNSSSDNDFKYGSGLGSSVTSAYAPRSEPGTSTGRQTLLGCPPQQQDQHHQHYQPPPRHHFDPFNPVFPEDETNDDSISESTWESSTNFGGKTFMAALEVD